MRMGDSTHTRRCRVHAASARRAQEPSGSVVDTVAVAEEQLRPNSSPPPGGARVSGLGQSALLGVRRAQPGTSPGSPTYCCVAAEQTRIIAPEACAYDTALGATPVSPAAVLRGPAWRHAATGAAASTAARATTPDGMHRPGWLGATARCGRRRRAAILVWEAGGMSGTSVY